MLDAYDKVLKSHLENFLMIGSTKIQVIGLSSEDPQDQQLVSLAGTGEIPDTVKLPLLSLVRLPDIEITDNPNTKRAMGYSAYPILETPTMEVKLNTMRCNLKYSGILYAETRKVTEDISIQTYFRLRNNNQLKVDIQLPLKDKNQNPIWVQCSPDIVLNPMLTQVRTQQHNTSQLYKLQITLTLQNCLIFDISTEEYYNLEYTVTTKMK